MLDHIELQRKEKERVKKLKDNLNYENRAGYNGIEMQYAYLIIGIMVYTIITFVLASVVN